ncbi:ankyrin repeat domain-containing protein [Sagittula sp. MA-2]|uniref:ankyrin repeat domain-containing protein n=1 Tax=Sagittula sp. MA-2 TaxID=3048007 RepID=UPI0024C3CDCF|nr:ankyrin repeat domain-containing protein [Sagittula sp. MA-2]WHZ36043.1 ankyrin repeat domain-containing protein [Sagittula sp. MA-2]
MSETSLDKLRLDAKLLHRAWIAREPWAVERVRQHPPRKDLTDLVRADFLFIIAQENGFASWPRLKAEAERTGLDRAARLQRLKVALAHGQVDLAETLLADTPDLPDGLFGLECALYRRAAVEQALAARPELAVQQLGPRTPILHLSFSRWIHKCPELEGDMLAIADLLVEHGADVNDGLPGPDGHRLSALYGAIGHADNMALGEWLLDHGADPNDGESLYHATELGHHGGLRLLLAAGATPEGTNALFRAMDFNDHVAVGMLLEAYSDTGEMNGGTIPALHHAARRGSDRRMAEMLLDAGADPEWCWQDTHPLAFAKVYGNAQVAAALEARGVTCDLSREEALLVCAAEGLDSPGDCVVPNRLAGPYRNIVREILHLPDRLDHLQRLVAVGLPFDAADAHGVTPVQIAGWEGLPEIMGWLLSLRPDLSHVNGYGGTLLSTILHGSENNPARADRDHEACLRLALEAGVALPRHVITATGSSDLRQFLSDWAEARPGQVV